MPEALDNLAALWIGENAASGARDATGVVVQALDLIAEPALSVQEPSETSTSAADALLDNLDFYQLFLRRLRTLTAKTPATDQDLLTHLDIGKPQLRDWLKRATEEGQVTRLNKPVRYQWQTARPEQNLFFVHDELRGEG